MEGPKMIILLIVPILVFGFGGYRMGLGRGYCGGGGLSLI
jgi:5-formyltetrahydrofolate cyclo-ligase